MAEAMDIGAGLGDTAEAAAAVATAGGIEVIPVAGSMGAEVRGVDLADVSDEAFGIVKRAFLEHKALVFPNQTFTSAQQIAWTARFGKVERHPLYRSKVMPGHPEILVLEHKKGEWFNGRNDVWHTDITFGERPPLGSMLYCRAIQSGFGDTMFSDMEKAYEALSEGMRRLLDTLTAVHDSSNLIHRNNTQDNNAAIGEMPPAVTHPVVRTHPETGRKCLFVNSGFTRHFTGMTAEESRPLLEFLFAHAVQPAFVYRHRWHIDDAVMWDNRCTMHYAVPDYGPDMYRLMHRTTANGDRPV
jgi:alpha-ketoglutarate-dependent taurine dioxygenase